MADLPAPIAPAIASNVAARLSNVSVEVKTETPFLPKAAFFLISVASLAGVYLTGRLHGLEGIGLVWRWLQFWGLALASGMLAWRLFYLRRSEMGLNDDRVGALSRDLLRRVGVLRRFLVLLLLVGAPAPWFVHYLGPWQAAALTTISLATAGAVLGAHERRSLAFAAFFLGSAGLALWGWSDSLGLAALAVIRTVHLLAFAAWLGGALFNLGAAVPAGRRNPNLDAVVAGARQLERFRWVVRTALPTVILTGVWLALRYGGVTSSFWHSGLGLLVPLKLALILALVVIFITCPLYRACSPVRGVCNLDDLGPAED